MEDSPLAEENEKQVEPKASRKSAGSLVHRQIKGKGWECRRGTQRLLGPTSPDMCFTPYGRLRGHGFYNSTRAGVLFPFKDGKTDTRQCLSKENTFLGRYRGPMDQVWVSLWKDQDKNRDHGKVLLA